MKEGKEKILLTNIDTLIKGSRELEIDLGQAREEKFKLYKSLLKEWNEKIDITTITEDKEVDIKHFLDSLMLVDTELFDADKKIIDIGTGGGFPGLPLKIYNDRLEVTLMDSLNKRINFLNQVIGSLGLKKIEAIHGRAEELSITPKYREQYDICVSRAVAQLNTLAEYCLPFVKVGGYFVAMKGPEYGVELNEAKNAIKILGGEVVDDYPVKIPESDIYHSIIIIKKLKNTPKKYPRGGGKPRKKPL